MKVTNIIWLALFEYINDNIDIHIDELTERVETIIAEYCHYNNKIIVVNDFKLMFKDKNE